MISSSVWAAAPRTQQPLSPAPALLTPTVLAMLCAQLIWKWFDFLPGFLWLCCKWEPLRGISLFCWQCIVCPLSRWLIQVTDEENRAPILVFQLLFHEAATKRAALHPACPRPSTSTWRALSHPLQSQRCWQALPFFSPFPYLLPEDLYLVGRGSWEPSVCSNQKVSGQFLWPGSVVAGGTVCTQISMFISKGGDTSRTSLRFSISAPWILCNLSTVSFKNKSQEKIVSSREYTGSSELIQQSETKKCV